MKEEQIKEVMRLADELADASAGWRAELGTYLRTIGEPENVFPLNPNGSSKWAHLQKHDGAQAIGVVFRTGSGSVGSLVDGRVVWADWLAHPNGSKPESVNAELLEALKRVSSTLEAIGDLPSMKADVDAAIARAESAIETPAKVSPFADQQIIDYVKGVYAFLESTSPAGFADEAFRLPPFATRAQQLFADAIQGDELGKCMGSEGKDSKNRERHEGAVAKVSPCAGHATQQDADLRQIVGIKEAVAGIAEFFEGEYHSGITGIVDASKVRGERVEDECRPEFDHCYVTQDGGGFDGDDFHGTVYFHIGNGEYATVDY